MMPDGRRGGDFVHDDAKIKKSTERLNNELFMQSRVLAIRVRALVYIYDYF